MEKGKQTQILLKMIHTYEGAALVPRKSNHVFIKGIISPTILSLDFYQTMWPYFLNKQYLSEAQTTQEEASEVTAMVCWTRNGLMKVWHDKLSC
jgi:hypothetical protein